MVRSLQSATITALLLVLSCGGEDVPWRLAATATGAGGGLAGATGSSTGTVIAGGGGKMQLPARFFLSGKVVDEDDAPVEGATVLQGGKQYELPHATTKADGSFELEMTYPGYGRPTVVAAKHDFRSAGEEIYSLPSEPLLIKMDRIKAPDNEAYVYGDPGKGGDPSTLYCGHCHEKFVVEFQTSKHAQATKNPIVQDLYAGRSRAHNDATSCTQAGGRWQQGLQPGTAMQSTGKCYLGGGVLPDLNSSCGGPMQLSCDDPTLPNAQKPQAFGACADCHAAGINGKAGGRNLHEATGIAFENGVHCDVCHKVKDIDMDKPAGIGQRLVLHRPGDVASGPDAELKPVFYGPLLDVPNGFMGGSYRPVFNEARFCAGCHEQKQAALVPGDTLDTKRWPQGLPVHSTFSEWEAGPYKASGTPCQVCHMPADYELTSSIDLGTVENQSIAFGFPRPPEDLRHHTFRSPLHHGSPRLIDTALFVQLSLSQQGADVEASVSLSNVGCGHAIPTGEPMRSLVLLVRADGVGCNKPLPPRGGMTINDIGGALARGVAGKDLNTSGSELLWAQGAQLAQKGHVVRVVRPSGIFDDYSGVGFFADPTLSAAQKGLQIHTPVAVAAVTAVSAGKLQLAAPLALLPNDVVYLGDPQPEVPKDGSTSMRLAGAAGYTFARVLSDSAGNRGVPHYRAVDMVSDNRIPPGKHAVTKHVFEALSGCSGATVKAWVLYRPHPTALAALRGWSAKDYVIASATASLALP